MGGPAALSAVRSRFTPNPKSVFDVSVKTALVMFALSLSAARNGAVPSSAPVVTPLTVNSPSEVAPSKISSDAPKSKNAADSICRPRPATAVSKLTENARAAEAGSLGSPV